MSDVKFKTRVKAEAGLQLPNELNNRALVVDADYDVIASNVSTTQLEYLVGVNSPIQDQLDDKIDLAEKGAANGVATLDGAGKIPAAQLPNSVMEYKGNYDAATNTPSLTNGTGNAGDTYRVSVSGTRDFGAGPIELLVGDLVIYDGALYQRSPASDAPVLSVNGQTGVVVLDSDDIAEGVTNLYFTDERAQDAVGTILLDGTTIDFTYDDGTPSITAEVKTNSLDNTHIATGADVARNKLDQGTPEAVVVNDATGVMTDIVLTTNQVVTSDGSTLIAAEIVGLNGVTVTQNAGDIEIALADQPTGTIPQTGFVGAQTVTNQNVTGLVFDPISVSSFKALVSVQINATTPIYEVFELTGSVLGGLDGYNMSISATGDDSLVSFSIDTAGQVKYTSGTYAGFVSLKMKFRASVLGYE